MPKLDSSGMRAIVLPIALLVLVSLIFKWVYLRTAESSYNIEELPLSAMTLAAGTDVLADTGASRLYGTSQIITALSIKAFGFTALGLKFPNIVFFLLAIVFLALFCRRLPALKEGWLWLVPATLLALGPPVIQMWSMKNRGGFIENIFALVLCLWICARQADGEALSDVRKFSLALVIGLATWSQPIAVVWGAIVVAYVVWQDLRYAPTSLPRTSLVVLAGLVLGLLPLIQLNFLFNFRTFSVLGHGELVGGVDLGMQGRAKEMFFSGIPRLLGLKEQWSSAWVIAKPLALALYAVFVWPAVWGAIRAASEFVRTGKFGLEVLLLGVAIAVMGANIISSWGNFQLEPRRLLLLYIPFAVLTVLGLARFRVLLVLYVVTWLVFSIWANYGYVRKNLFGFSDSMYQPLDEVAEFLMRKQVSGVYSDVWVGGRVTFASKGRIPWYQSNYDPSGYGYIGDSILNKREAMLFNLGTQHGKSAKDSFATDATTVGVECEETTIQNLSVIFACSKDVDLQKLPFDAMKHSMKPGEVVIDLSASDPAVSTQVGKIRDGVLVAQGRPGFVSYGPYRKLPEGSYRVEVSGSASGPFILDVVARNGERTLAKAVMDEGSGDGSRNLAQLDFVLDEMATDLEVRILVPSNSDLELDGYKVIVR